MRAELPVLSFICSTTLIVSILTSRHIRTNFIDICIISWLLLCNVVHGVDSILWANNVGFHIPIWCDIMTKFLLGALMALPAACVCISRDLERLASTRKIHDQSDTCRRRRLVDVAACILLPFIFMSIHSIAQDHRFDLVADFGCFASIHSSLPALSIVWLPPLITCSISFVFSGFTLYHILKMRPASLSFHLTDRSSMSASLFARRLIFSFTATTLYTIIIFFSFFSPPHFVPWTSWASVHEDFFDIQVLDTPSSEVDSIEVTWWLTFIVTVLYLCLCVIRLGAIRCKLVHWKSCFHMRTEADLLPTHGPRRSACTLAAMTKPHLQPRNVEIKSGWDEMLDPKTPQRKSMRLNLGTRSPPPSLRTSSPSSPSSSREDDVFMASTSTYLNSYAAHTLGLTGFTPASPPPGSLPSLTEVGSDTSDDTLVGTESIAAVPKNYTQRYVEDNMSAISSICDVPWPLPPSTVPPSPLSVVSPHIRSPSTDSHDSFGYALYPTLTPPHLQSYPFQGPGVTVTAGPTCPTPTASTSFLRVPSVRKYKSRERLRRLSPNDVIHMTVMKETE